MEIYEIKDKITKNKKQIEKVEEDKEILKEKRKQVYQLTPGTRKIIQTFIDALKIDNGGK